MYRTGFLVAWAASLPFAASSSSAAAAFQTGKYRNLFAEDGHSALEIESKINRAYQQLFHGDSQTQAIAFAAGTNANGPLMYITDWANDDVRTESMSYGMMIAVQPFGYFSWSCKTDGTPNEETPAPEREEYFAMALLFAGNRWPGGNGYTTITPRRTVCSQPCFIVI